MSVTDEVVRAELRAAMDGAVATPPLAPAWDRLEHGLRRVRRRRRLARAGKVTGGLAVVAAALVAIQTNTVPYPSWATVTIPASGGTSGLADGPVRGSLQDDAAFLRGLRERVAGQDASRESGGEVWSPPSAGDVDVLFAGDVGPYRIALVEGPWHWGLISSPQQVWYSGPRGAAPQQLEQGANNGPEDTAVGTWQHGSYVADQEPVEGQAVVVVVSSKDVAVSLRRPPRYAADGTVERGLVPVPEVEPGVHQTVVTEPGTFELVVPGRDWTERITAFSVPDAAAAATPGFGPPARGGAAPPPDEQAAEELYGLLAADLPATGTPRRLLWAGDVAGDRYRVVDTVAPSGAHVVSVLRHGFSGADLATWVVSGGVLPRGPQDDVALAWRFAVDDQAVPVVPGPRVAAMGPAGAIRAEFLDAGNSPVADVAVTGGLATAESATAVAVRFTDAEGRALGDVVPVRAPISMDQQIYGS